MNSLCPDKQTPFSRKIIANIILLAFFFNTITPAGAASAGGLGTPSLITSSVAAFQPPMLLGLKIHPENPLLFDFIVDQGQTKLSEDELKSETEKLVKYFLAALTIPDKEVWVNLSPTEKDRIIPDVLGQTVMGKTMLEQDYLLKQVAASLTNPDTDLGKKYWDEVNSQNAVIARNEGTKQSLSKVWIVPAKAEVLESNGIVLIGEKRLKVMMADEYENNLSFPRKRESLDNQNMDPRFRGDDRTSGDDNINVSSQIFRTTILPNIEKEVNEGKNFAQVRQIYNSVILAAWYKKALKESLLGKVYADKSKVAGVETDDKEMKQRIYEQYLQAFKKGVYNVIKEEPDAVTGDLIPRKYFSGGIAALTPEDFNVRQVSSAVISRTLSASSGILVTVQGVETGTGIQEAGAVTKKLSAASSAIMMDVGTPVDGKIVVDKSRRDFGDNESENGVILTDGKVFLSEGDNRLFMKAYRIRVWDFGEQVSVVSGRLYLDGAERQFDTTRGGGAYANEYIGKAYDPLIKSVTLVAQGVDFLYGVQVTVNKTDGKNLAYIAQMTTPTADVAASSAVLKPQVEATARLDGKASNDDIAEKGTDDFFTSQGKELAKVLLRLKDTDPSADVIMEYQKFLTSIMRLYAVENQRMVWDEEQRIRIVIQNAPEVIRPALEATFEFVMANHQGKQRQLNHDFLRVLFDARERTSYPKKIEEIREEMRRERAEIKLLPFRTLDAEWIKANVEVTAALSIPENMAALKKALGGNSDISRPISSMQQILVELRLHPAKYNARLYKSDILKNQILDNTNHLLVETGLATLIEVAVARTLKPFAGVEKTRYENYLAELQHTLVTVMALKSSSALTSEVKQTLAVSFIEKLGTVRTDDPTLQLMIRSLINEASLNIEPGTFAKKISGTDFSADPKARFAIIRLFTSKFLPWRNEIIKIFPELNEADMKEILKLIDTEVTASQLSSQGSLPAGRTNRIRLSGGKSKMISIEGASLTQVIFGNSKVNIQINPGNPSMIIYTGEAQDIPQLNPSNTFQEGVNVYIGSKPTNSAFDKSFVVSDATEPTHLVVKVSKEKDGKTYLVITDGDSIGASISGISILTNANSAQIIDGKRLPAEIKPQLLSVVLNSVETHQGIFQNDGFDIYFGSTTPLVGLHYRVAVTDGGELEFGLARTFYDANFYDTQQRLIVGQEYTVERRQEGDSTNPAQGNIIKLSTTKIANRQLRFKIDKLANGSFQFSAINPTADPKYRVFLEWTNTSASSSVATDDNFTKGGIDFDPTNMNLQIKRDGRGVPLPLPQQNLDQINIQGLFPIIINIVPINAQSLPIFLGQTPQEPAKDVEVSSLQS